MEYIILWIFALFGLWSLISNILESFYIANREGIFDVVLNVCNQENNIEYLIRELSRIELIKKIKIFDNNSTDSTVSIVKEIEKNNPKVTFVELHNSNYVQN